MNLGLGRPPANKHRADSAFATTLLKGSFSPRARITCVPTVQSRWSRHDLGDGTVARGVKRRTLIAIYIVGMRGRRATRASSCPYSDPKAVRKIMEHARAFEPIQALSAFPSWLTRHSPSPPMIS